MLNDVKQRIMLPWQGTMLAHVLPIYSLRIPKQNLQNSREIYNIFLVILFELQFWISPENPGILEWC